MSRHDDETRLRHMLEYAETAVEAIRGLSPMEHRSGRIKVGQCPTYLTLQVQA